MGIRLGAVFPRGLKIVDVLLGLYSGVAML